MSSHTGYLPTYRLREPETTTQTWPTARASNQHFTNTAVVIVGGGIAGMCTAIDLLVNREVKNFVILEKSGGFGGTWRDNKFPGCCCDVFSVLYSYSFAQNPGWSRMYPGQEEILDYLTDVAQKYGLYKYVRFHSTVDAATWNDKALKWETSVTVGGGKEAEFASGYKITSDFLISATGQLNKPKGIDVPGYCEFQGKIMHSARWDWSYDLKDKRIAIIGTGATTAQIVPEVARVASQLTVCQRTPAWVIPRHDATISSWKRWTYAHVPPVRSRARAEAMDIRESFHSAVTQSDSAYAGKMRMLNAMLLKTQLPDRLDLQEKLTPDYSPGCKRTVISDDYYPALARRNVRLETGGIQKFTTDGIKFEGRESADEYDLIVLATGFDTFSFLSPVKITGRNGRSLQDIWAHAPHAYKGVCVPDLPNFGMLYGPNTNLSHNSLILVIEAQARYLSAVIDKVLQARRRNQSLALYPREEATMSYWRRLQAALQKTSFSDPNCNSWWKRDDGVITNNWSGTAVDYQEILATVEWADYHAVGSASLGLDMSQATKIGRIKEETSLSRTTLSVIVIGTVGLLLHGLVSVF